MIMSDVGIEFRNELFYGDIVLASVTAADFGKVGFDIYYKLEKVQNNNNNNILIATVKTGMVCFDYTKKKIVAIPEEAKLNMQ